MGSVSNSTSLGFELMSIFGSNLSCDNGNSSLFVHLYILQHQFFNNNNNLNQRIIEFHHCYNHCINTTTTLNSSYLTLLFAKIVTNKSSSGSPTFSSSASVLEWSTAVDSGVVSLHQLIPELEITPMNFTDGRIKMEHWVRWEDQYRTRSDTN